MDGPAARDPPMRGGRLRGDDRRRPRMTAARVPHRYVIAWLGLSGFALIYLASLFYFPSFAQPQAEAEAVIDAARSPVALEAAPAAPDAADRLASEVEALRKLVQALGERVATLESALGPPTSALPPSDPPTATGALKQAKEHRKPMAAPLPKVAVTSSPLPEDGFGDTMLDRSPLPVASLKAPTRTLFAVELAMGEDAHALSMEWAVLSERHWQLLGALEARQHKDDGATIRLIAGPFANAVDAAMLCARLQTAGTPCKETTFAGEALPAR